jgi:cullin 1
LFFRGTSEFNAEAAASASAKTEHPEIANTEFSAQVLTQSYWPHYRIGEGIALPRHMSKWLVAFEDWYHRRHDQRTLQWVHTLGSCDVAATFPTGDKIYTLQMTPLQAITLLIFNDSPAEKGLKEVKERLGTTVKTDTVKRVLHSLSCGKYKVLSKTGSPNTISSSDSFRVNLDFKSKTRRPKIAMCAISDVITAAERSLSL